MKELWKYLKTAKKPIVLYGMGNGADKILNILSSEGIKADGIFVSDGFVKEKLFHGMPLTDYAGAKAKFGNMIILVCFGTSRTEVLENIKRIANEQELYVPDVPVYGSTLFNTEFAKEHKNELSEAYGMLSDTASKQCFENTVYYKITGKAEYLYSCETNRSETFTLLNAKETESYLDLGAYNGDTVKELSDISPFLKKIIAVEPDKRSFKKLCANTSYINFCECINACVGSENTTVYLKDRKGRGSNISNSGTLAEMKTVDNILNGEKTDYIKFDVEGNELSAIYGSKETILQHKPKLSIACYHRSEDIFTIPKAVLNIRNDYKIYMRHTKCLPAWDTDFIFI